jgi:phospholipid transport system substrate-binding protein
MKVVRIVSFRPAVAAAFAVLFVGLFAGPVQAEGDAKATIQSFDNALIDVMKNAEKLGFKGRYDKLEPVVEKSYDLPLMARISVGPQWASLSPDDQSKIIEAFKKLSVGTYASRFDGYGGEQFQITGDSPLTGGDAKVDTKLTRPHDDPVELDYRLRQTGGDWKIIDVFLSGTISQLANYRSEFSATLRDKGADGLVRLIDDKIAALSPKG